jgi:hypothetical protein
MTGSASFNTTSLQFDGFWNEKTDSKLVCFMVFSVFLIMWLNKFTCKWFINAILPNTHTHPYSTDETITHEIETLNYYDIVGTQTVLSKQIQDSAFFFFLTTPTFGVSWLFLDYGMSLTKKHIEDIYSHNLVHYWRHKIKVLKHIS